MHNLKDQLKLERGQWTNFHRKYKDFLDQFFILDHCEGILIAKVIGKKLDNHFNE